MKTLSANQTAAIAEQGRGVYSFLAIEWPSPWGTRYYAERDFTASPSVTVYPMLLGFPELKRSLNTSLASHLIYGEYQVTLRNDPDDTDRISEIIESLLTINGTAVTAYRVLEPLTGALASSDWINFGRYRIVDYVERTDTITLILTDWVEQPAAQIWGTRISTSDFATAPEESVGLVIPYIFGTVERCPFILVESGVTTNLQGDLAIGATTVPVDSVAGFPTSGTIIIDNEEISYTAVDAVSTPNTFGTGASPATRGARGADAAHSDEAPVTQKLTRYRYIVSHHTNVANANIQFRYRGTFYDIPAADYTITETTLNSHAITYFDWDQLPALGDGTLLTEDEALVVGDISGIDDPYTAGSQALSAPGNVIRHLALNADFLAMDASQLDTTSLDAAVAGVGGNIVFGRRLYRQQQKRELLETALTAAGIRGYWERGSLRFIATLDPDGVSADGALTLNDIFPREESGREESGDDPFLGSVERRVTRRDGDVINRLVLRWQQGFVRRATIDESGYEQSSTYEDTYSQAQSWGLRAEELSTPWIRDATSADELGAHLLSQVAWRRENVVLRGHLGLLQYEVGDVLTVADADTRLGGEKGRLVEVGFPRPERVQLTIAMITARTRIWERAADPTNTYIDRYSGLGHLVFVVDGTTSLVVTSTGRVLTAAGLREQPFTTETVQTATDSRNGEIEYNAGAAAISLAVPRASDGKYIQIALVNATRLRCGAFREDLDYPLAAASSPSFTYHYEWFAGPTALDFTIDLLRTFLRFERISLGGKTNARMHYGSYRESGV